jgi:hypothetical protein
MRGYIRSPIATKHTTVTDLSAGDVPTPMLVETAHRGKAGQTPQSPLPPPRGYPSLEIGQALFADEDGTHAEHAPAHGQQPHRYAPLAPPRDRQESDDRIRRVDPEAQRHQDDAEPKRQPPRAPWGDSQRPSSRAIVATAWLTISVASVRYPLCLMTNRRPCSSGDCGSTASQNPFSSWSDQPPNVVGNGPAVAPTSPKACTH